MQPDHRINYEKVNILNIFVVSKADIQNRRKTESKSKIQTKLNPDPIEKPKLNPNQIQLKTKSRTVL